MTSTPHPKFGFDTVFDNAGDIAYAASRVQILMISRAGEGFLRDLRNRVFDHLLKLSMPFYDREKAL